MVLIHTVKLATSSDWLIYGSKTIPIFIVLKFTLSLAEADLVIVALIFCSLELLQLNRLFGAYQFLLQLRAWLQITFD